MKTLKFTIIRQTIEKNHEIYSEGCKQGPSKVTKITNFRSEIEIEGKKVEINRKSDYLQAI